LNLIIHPGAPLYGEVCLPGDKSLSHRAALLAAMSEGESRIENFLVSGVTEAMLSALTALGVTWELDGTCLRVQGQGTAGLKPPSVPIHCGNSATTIRLLAGALAAAGLPAVLDGSEGLRRRPMQRIVAPLRLMGVDITAQDGCAPLHLGQSLRPLAGIDHALTVASAQVKSCLLLAALAAAGPTTLREPGPSRDHTERMLRSLGIRVESEVRLAGGSVGEEYITRLFPPKQIHLPPLHLRLPGDPSTAAFWIVAALITPGSQVTLRRVGMNPTRTGLIDTLLEMGADIQVQPLADHGGEPVGNLIVRSSTLQAAQVSGTRVVRMIDEFPVFAVAAAYARGRTVVSHAEELHIKESDRIAALCVELRAIGVSATEAPDGFVIEGGKPPAGGVVQAHGDHRLAMALAVAGLAAQAPVTVQGAEIAAESFPDFAAQFFNLGGQLSSD